MSAKSTDTEAIDPLEGPRVCPECEGFGSWKGGRSRGELIVECVSCGATWTAPEVGE